MDGVVPRGEPHCKVRWRSQQRSPRGFTAADGLYSHAGFEFGTVDLALGQLLRKRFCLRWEARVGAVRPVSEVNDCLGPENLNPPQNGM